MDGIENPSEEFHNITRWLVKHGYSDADIKKILGENLLRVMSQVERVASEMRSNPAAGLSK